MADDGTIDKGKGRLKEAAGDLTDDQSLKNEGKVDKASGGLKNTIGDAADKVKDAVNPARRSSAARCRARRPAAGPTLASMIDELVAQIEARFAELEGELSDPEVIGDRERFEAASRAYRELEPAATLAAEYRHAADDAAGARELLAEDGEDPELRALLETSRERLAALEEEIRLAMVERDPNDDKNVIVEIRPGAGGDEAGLWAGDLYRMLTRYAERRGFKVEPLSIGDGDYTFAIKGDGAYSVFKFEGGTHRVQRVPETESQGRIHTSTATVAVLPEAEDVEVAGRPQRPPDRRLPQLGPGRAVGQHHRLRGADHPQADRDRRLDAGREVPAAEPRAGDARAARAALRAGARRAAGRDRRQPPRPRSAPGERAEKIRTYNYGEKRVKDHRINLLVHNLDEILMGELDELTDALQDDEKRRRLEEQRGWLTTPPSR